MAKLIRGWTTMDQSEARRSRCVCESPICPKAPAAAPRTPVRTIRVKRHRAALLSALLLPGRLQLGLLPVVPAPRRRR